MLAANTNYATMVTTPKYRSRKIKFLQLTDVDDYQVLAVIVLEGNIVKNRMFRSDVALVKEDVLKLNLALNTFLQGLDIEEINIGLVQKLKSQVGAYQELVSEILDAIATAIQEEGDKDELTQFVDNGEIKPDEKRGIQVYIGDENKVDSMKDCSVVTATYEIEEGIYGKVGIIGPKRMDYERVVGTLQNMMGQLDDIFKNKKS